MLNNHNWDAITEIRKKLNITQKQFADMLGCSLMTARRIESGDFPTNKAVKTNLEKLAKKAGIPLKK